MRFLVARATGVVPTGAKFLRNFVQSHPSYNRDSMLNQQINYDILQMMSGLNSPDCDARRTLLGEWA